MMLIGGLLYVFGRHCQLVGSGTDYREESIAQETVDGF
ncbi:hypothetical protein QF001_000806 [Paraburkholderia youngii]